MQATPSSKTEPKNLAITGAAGYIGQMLLSRLAGQPGIGRIKAIDLRPPKPLPAGVEFVRCDVRDRGLVSHLAGSEIVIHLAFIVADIHDRELTYDINVRGSRNLLGACEQIQPEKLVVASSVAAYGRQPRDNRLINEETPLLGDNASYYLHTKRILEEDLDTFEKRNPHIIVTRLRPSILLGPQNHNFAHELGRFPLFPRVTPPILLPVVHEEDVIEAFALAVERDAPGAFIISLPEAVSLEDMARAMGKRMFSLSEKHLMLMLSVLYRLHLTQLSKDWMISGTGSWRFDLTRSREVLGWEPKHDLATTLSEMMENIRRRRLWNRLFQRS